MCPPYRVSPSSSLIRTVSAHAIANTTTEMWTIYKEVMTYYAAGLVPPDDVTLMFTDDNWGNIQRLPIDDEADRAGGIGVRHHSIPSASNAIDTDDVV